MAKKRRRHLRPRFEMLVLARVDRERREIVEAVLDKEWTFQQLAQATGFPVKTLRGWLKRARQSRADRLSA